MSVPLKFNVDAERLETDKTYREFYLEELDQSHEETFDFDFDYRCQYEKGFDNRKQTFYKFDQGKEIWLVESGRGLTDKEADQRLSDWLKIYPSWSNFMASAYQDQVDYRSTLELRRTSPQKSQIIIKLISKSNDIPDEEIIEEFPIEDVKKFLEFFLEEGSTYFCAGPDWGMECF